MMQNGLIGNGKINAYQKIATRIKYYTNGSTNITLTKSKFRRTWYLAAASVPNIYVANIGNEFQKSLSTKSCEWQNVKIVQR